MHILEAIESRRSVREYLGTPIERADVEALIEAAIEAPSAINQQSWAFVVVQDPKLLQRYSDAVKPRVLATLSETALPPEFEVTLRDPEYHVFHRAPTLIVIYARPGDSFATVDCCLAAQNLMLAAHARGLATCWIGLAVPWLDRKSVKRDLGVPEDWTAVAPIVVGRPKGPPPRKPPRRPPDVIWRAGPTGAGSRIEEGIMEKLAKRLSTKGRTAVRDAYEKVETKVLAAAGRRAIRQKTEAIARVGKKAVKTGLVVGAVAATGVAVREIAKRRTV